MQEFVAFKEWSGGAGRKDTEKFTTAADRFRVSWKTLTGDPDPIGSLGITVRSGAGALVKIATNLGQKISSGHFDVLTAPGEYYLEIDSADRNWQVSVEQPRKGN